MEFVAFVLAGAAVALLWRIDDSLASIAESLKKED